MESPRFGMGFFVASSMRRVGNWVSQERAGISYKFDSCDPLLRGEQVTLKQFLLEYGNREFRCPKCRSYMFGSSEKKGSTDRVYHCHGNGEWTCDFLAPSWEEFQKYFVFSV